MEEDFTPEQQELIRNLSTVSEALADWARDQLREGFTARQLWERLKRASEIAIPTD